MRTATSARGFAPHHLALFAQPSSHSHFDRGPCSFGDGSGRRCSRECTTASQTSRCESRTSPPRFLGLPTRCLSAHFVGPRTRWLGSGMGRYTRHRPTHRAPHRRRIIAFGARTWTTHQNTAVARPQLRTMESKIEAFNRHWEILESELRKHPAITLPLRHKLESKAPATPLEIWNRSRILFL